MRKLTTKKIKKLTCLVLVLTLLVSMLLQSSQVEVKAATTTTWVPITCYTNTTSNVTTYTTSDLTKTTGYICSGDLCTITKIYSNGAVEVTYPISGGKYKKAYASSKKFFGNINFSTTTVCLGSKLTVYRKSTGTSTIGTVFATDKVMVCGAENGRTQIIYPAGNSWKLGWVSGTYSADNKTSSGTKLSYGLYKNNSAYISCGFDGYKNTKGRHEGIDIQGGNGSSIYSLTDGEVVRVTYGYRGSNGLSTIAIYDSSADKTVVYLHSAPVTLKVGQKISKGQKIGTQDWRGCSSASGGHTHVEVVNGKSNSAKKSVNDYNLQNSNPTSYWNSKGYTIN